MKNSKLLPVMACLLASGSAFASSLADDLTGNLYIMNEVYRTEYAPAAWKKAYAGYDLDTSFAQALAAVQANPNLSIRDSREILKNFVYAMKDYHTSISFVSTETATLPLSIKGTDSKFFIVYIDRTKLAADSFPYQIGDEVVTFDGKNTADAVATVQAETPANVPTTDKALAEMYLTSRSGARGLDVPQGPITLGIRPRGQTAVSQVELIWNYTPEHIAARGSLSSLVEKMMKAGSFISTFGLGDAGDGTSPSPAPAPVAATPSIKLFLPHMDVQVDAAPSVNPPGDNPYTLGMRKTFTPDLGAKIWTSEDASDFYAYIYKNEAGKLIGYVRIPQYEADDYGKAVGSFAKIIALFESTTDSMIIDEVNNPGGSVFYMYSLISMLATQPMTTPLHRMSITQSDVSDALTTITQLAAVKTDEDAKKAIPSDSMDGYPSSYELAQFTLNSARFTVNEWNAGRKLTNPSWIGGVDHINPAAVHYTKPILLMINHLDFSGGDFFPATLQDNGRVTIFGARTAGAGGYVNDIQVQNNIGVNAFRCTESIAERVSQNPIENLGVKPDIAYDMTENDFANNYSDYAKAIQAAVTSITK